MAGPALARVTILLAEDLFLVLTVRAARMGTAVHGMSVVERMLRMGIAIFEYDPAPAKVGDRCASFCFFERGLPVWTLPRSIGTGAGGRAFWFGKNSPYEHGTGGLTQEEEAPGAEADAG